jgi:hypothetical protein
MRPPHLANQKYHPFTLPLHICGLNLFIYLNLLSVKVNQSEDVIVAS